METDKGGVIWACRVLQERKHRGLKWAISDHHTGVSVTGHDGERFYYLHPDDAIAVAEKLERDAAPPAASAEGDADLARKIIASEIEGLSDDSEAYLHTPDCVSIASIPVSSLRALLAAAEKAGPGPATRRLFENLSPVCGEAADHSKISFKNQFRVSGYVLAGVIREAARECGSEVPR